LRTSDAHAIRKRATLFRRDGFSTAGEKESLS
jgi:hypothetical protein